MPDAHEPQGEQEDVNEPADLGPMPSESQDQEEAPCDDQAEAGDGEEPEEPEEPQEPYQIILQGFRTVSQTLSAAYRAASSEIYTVLRDKGMMGILQESSKAGPIKCRYVIYMLHSVEGQIIDARDSDYRRDWNIGLVMVKNLRSLKSLKNLIRLSFKVFGLYPRPCRWPTGPLAPRYTLSSGKAWQKQLLKTGLSCGEPPGPYVTG